MNEQQNINELPKDWKWVRLGEVAKIKGGKRLPKGEQYSEERTQYPYLRVVNFENMTINKSGLKFLNEKTHKQIKNYTINSDDLYISIAGTIGRVGMIPQSLSGANLTENAAKITEIKDFDLKYLSFVLNSYKIQHQIAEKTIATTQPKLALYRIEKLELALPPKHTQQAIVSKIEELFSELDKGIEQLKTAQHQLKTYRQSVLKWAFEGKLTNNNVKDGELPEGWKEVQTKDVAFVNPKLPNKENIDGNLEVQFLPMKLVEEIINKIHLDEIKKFHEVQKGSYTPFIDGDIIFAKVTPCMENGKTAVVDKLKNGIGYGSSEFHVIRCTNEAVNKYIFYFLVQDRFRSEAENAMTGAVGLRRVPKQFIENYTIPLPLIEEQNKIVQEIESRLSVADKMEESITQSLQQAEALRQSILKKAFEGRLVKK